MITLYYDKKNNSCKQAMRWFIKYGIEVRKRDVSHISKEKLFHILTLSQNGFFDILRNPAQSGTKLNHILEDINESDFDESLKIILAHPGVLKVPIIFDEKKLVVGYNVEDIRIFLPNRYRKIIKKLY